jgi:hypothetical protein
MPVRDPVEPMEGMMRTIAVLCTAVLLVGCAKSEKQAGAGAEPAAIALADVAGTWNVSAMPAVGDSVLTTYQLTATADTTGWTITFPGRPPIPVRVAAVAGDSIVVEAGPYESVLRPGVMVSTHTVNRLQDGKLVGTFTAHYQSAAADSVLNGRQEGVRGQ